MITEEELLHVAQEIADREASILYSIKPEIGNVSSVALPPPLSLRLQLHNLYGILKMHKTPTGIQWIALPPPPSLSLVTDHLALHLPSVPLQLHQFLSSPSRVRQCERKNLHHQSDAIENWKNWVDMARILARIASPIAPYNGEQQVCEYSQNFLLHPSLL